MKKQWLSIANITAIVFGIGILSLCWHNANTNIDFWKINAFNGFTMIWAVVFSYLIGRSQQRSQRRRDVLYRLLNELLLVLSNPSIVSISADADRDMILMNKRDINNKVNLIAKYANYFTASEDISLLTQHYSEYDEFLSDHIDNMEYLAQSSKELHRPIVLMRDKIYDIMMKV